MAGLSDVLQIMIADLSDEQITITAGLTDILQTTMADTIEILLEDHYEVQQFLEMIPANALKNGLVVLKSINGRKL
ncbi:unnamed protein product [Rhizophagus irregularis]|uniref:Uncharacterized protein n=1 Tax=Rhizophagus irregularis TaxID=588596 RepID=A0A915ZAR2_9GLOM|nr:unnamed protein product [Rhizophagus irregularis]